MGGIGSGSRRQRATVEDCLILDTSVLARLGCFQRGSLTRKEMHFLIEGFRVATAVFETDLRCERYQPQMRVTMSPVNEESFRQVIALRDITPTFGGLRWYFRSRDAKRCQKLYLPLHARRFGTREEYQLTYRTKQVSPANRVRMRAHRLREALPGAKHGNYPPRPRGMHHRTYDNLVARLREADSEVDKLWLAFVGDWADKQVAGGRQGVRRST
jgi:hypothetical protein